MSLRALQRLFGAVLMDGADAGALEDGVVGDERASAAERVAIYTRMYRLRLVDVLAEVYPRCRALVGPEAFDALAEVYVRERPSRTPSLRGYGADFADGLSEALPAELCRLEWARYAVFDAPDEPLLGREALAGLAPEALVAVPLRRIRASRLVTLRGDLDAAWRGEAGSTDGEATWLVWRETPQVFHRRLSVAEAALLARLEAPLSIGALCDAHAGARSVEDAAAEVFALLGRWIADSLLAAA